MESTYTYVTQSAILAVFFGIGLYQLDRWLGVKLCRLGYNLTHKDPRPASVVRGFIYGQRWEAQTAIASIVSTAAFGYMLYRGEKDLVAMIIMWGIDVPLMIIGFRIGAPIYGIFKRKEKIFASLDRMEEQIGQTDLSTERAKVLSSASSLAVKAQNRFWDLIWPIDRKSAKPIPSEVPQAAAPKEEDPREALRRYTRS